MCEPDRQLNRALFLKIRELSDLVGEAADTGAEILVEISASGGAIVREHIVIRDARDIEPHSNS